MLSTRSLIARGLIVALVVTHGFVMNGCKRPRITGTQQGTPTAPTTPDPVQFVRAMSCLLRHKVGALRGAADTERLLNQWLDQEVAPEGGSSSNEARPPLPSASIRASEHAEKPSTYSIEIEIPSAYVRNIAELLGAAREFGSPHGKSTIRRSSVRPQASTRTR